MPSTATTTKKPNDGSCAACNKEGAALRCAPCRDAGVDVFFCNRECQVKQWKIHKAVCKKTCNSNLKKEQSSANKENKEEMMKRLKHRDELCDNCFISKAAIGSKMSLCSKCKKGFYCSRECQVAHWPKHKHLCKHNCEVTNGLERSLDSTGKKIYDLCQKWIAKINAMNSFRDVVHCALKTEDMEHQPPVKVVRMEIEFNYNAQTFIVTEVPRAVEIDDLSQTHKELIRKLLKESVGEINEGHTHVVTISTKELGKRVSNNIAIEITKKELDQMNDAHFDMLSALDHMNADRKSIDMSKLRYLFAQVRLKSDLFRGWKSIRRNNIQKQMEQMNLGQAFTAFLQNALLSFCNKSLQNTHRIVVFMNMGKEIGQISQLLHYVVKPNTEFKEYKEAVEKIMSHVEDTGSRPLPCNKTTIETLFVDPEIFFAFEYTVLCGDGMPNKTAKQCQKDADNNYRKLQKSVKEMPSDLLDKVSL